MESMTEWRTDEEWVIRSDVTLEKEMGQPRDSWWDPTMERKSASSWELEKGPPSLVR